MSDAFALVLRILVAICPVALITFGSSCFGKHPTIPMPLDTADHILGPLLIASIGSQEIEDRVSDSRGQSSFTGSASVACRSNSTLRRFISLVSVDFEHCASCGFAFCQLPEQSNSEDVSLSMPGHAWQDVSLVICDWTRQSRGCVNISMFWSRQCQLGC